MNERTSTDLQKTTKATFTPARTGLLQRQCACGQHTFAGGECEECRKKREGMLQRAPASSAPVNGVPPIMHDVLRSPGQPLDPATRAFMELRFGHDFSRIPTHSPTAGVIQTKLTINMPGDEYEQEADRIADQVMASPWHTGVRGAPPRIQRFSGQSNGHLDAAPASVDQALASPGRPLEPPLRQDMEQRFGCDFSRVRVHADGRAVESAQAVHAQAYTVGSDLVFARDKYAPSTTAGKQLLAHELVHVVQQSGASSSSMLSRKPEDCPADRVEEPDHPGDCPEITRGRQELKEAKSAVPAVETGIAGECYLLANLASGSTNFGSPKEFEEISDFLQMDSSLTLHITGFTDCVGTADENSDLRMKRAYAVENYFTGVLGVDPKRIVVEMAADTEYVTANNTPEGRSRNRSVALYLGAPKTLDCPPLSNAPANTLDDYIDLIRCAERISGYTPPQMLTMLRQMYYGKSWSATSQTDMWDKVIPCSPNIGKPKTMLGPKLFGALWSSATVQGVDVGHIFTGLEAMTCPKSSVTVSTSLPLGTVKMENEAFATWGGDVAAAAAAMVACWNMDDAERANSLDCGNEPIPQGLPFYFIAVQTTPEDLEGDIDSFLMRAAENGIPCAGSAMQTFNPSRPVSEMFASYYHNAGPLGRTHQDRYRCFVEAIGGKVVGKKIDNRSDLIRKHRAAIESFAETYYLKIMMDARGASIGVPQRIIAHGTSVTRLQFHAVNALNLLFDWIDHHL